MKIHHITYTSMLIFIATWHMHTLTKYPTGCKLLKNHKFVLSILLPYIKATGRRSENNSLTLQYLLVYFSWSLPPPLSLPLYADTHQYK